MEYCLNEIWSSILVCYYYTSHMLVLSRIYYIFCVIKALSVHANIYSIYVKDGLKAFFLFINKRVKNKISHKLSSTAEIPKFSIKWTPK